MTDNKPHRYHLSFDLSKSEDARAWQYLSELDRAKYKSISQAIVTAVNAYFSQEGAAEREPPARSEPLEEQLGQVLQKILPGALMQAIQQLVLRDAPPIKTAEYAAVPQNVHENVPKAEISEDTLSFLLGE